MGLLILLFTSLLAFRTQLFTQPGALYPSFGQSGIGVTTESMTTFENILSLANGQNTGSANDNHCNTS